MWCLRWKWEDGKEGFVVGLPDDLHTVYFCISKHYPTIKFSLKTVDTGCDVDMAWLDKNKKLVW